MEVRIYKTMKHYSDNMPLYVGRVGCLDAFEFTKCLDVMRSIYGSDVIIVFLCV